MIDLDSMSDDDKLAALESIHKSIAESKEVQKQKIAANVDLVLQALKKMESDIRARYDETGKAIERRVANIKDGRDGRNGIDGKPGKDGKSGRDGLQGARGIDGLNGINGIDGQDGVSVVNANIDFDGSLIITLSDGRELNVGEVVSQELAQKIQVISTMSTNGAVGISDEGSSISTGVKNINFVGATVTATNSGDDVTVNVSAGTGTVTSVAVSGGTTGLTTSGGPITTTGTITLAGTLAVASGGTGTATPSLVAGTNITSITGSWPNQTINAGGGSGTVTSVAATVPAFLSVTGSPITTSGTLAIGLSGSALPVANGGTGVTSSTGTTNVVLSNSPVLVTPDLGTPSALVGTNITGTATAFTASNVTTNANLTGAVTSIGNATSLGSFTSAQLLGALTDETGTGAAVFATSPTLITPALGTPASGVVTNLTGTASININGTVGATTANTGAFTTLSASGVTTVQAGTAALPAITTTGDTNTGIFFPAADTIAFTEGGAESMRITSAGNVGIGTTSPSDFGAGFRMLAVSGSSTGILQTINSTDSVTTEMESESSRGAIGTRTNHPLVFKTNQTERARIDSSGNLGIGTSSPGAKLHLKQSGANVNGIYIEGSANDSQVRIFNNGTVSGISSTYGSTGSYLPLTFLTSDVERARIDSSGNLGVGVTSITGGYKAQINGNLLLGTAANPLLVGTTSLNFLGDNTSSSGVRLDSSGNVGINNTSPAVLATTTQVAIKANSSADSMFVAQNSNGLTTAKFGFQFTGGVDNPVIGSYTNHPFLFQTNNTERARITSDGNLFVGCTATPSASVSGIQLSNPLGVASKSSVGATTSGVNHLIFFNGNGDVGRISTSGSSTSYATSSDYRLKNTITPMTGALAKVALLKPCTYKWNADNSNGEGFIAHELAEVCPDAVAGEKDAVDAEGNPQYQGIDVSFLVATLTAAIQEQQALITTLTQRITALEAK